MIIKKYGKIKEKGGISMINVSSDFKEAMKQPVKEIQAYITGENIDIRDDTDLIQFKISADSGLCKTTMRKLEAKILGSYNPK